MKYSVKLKKIYLYEVECEASSYKEALEKSMIKKDKGKVISISYDCDSITPENYNYSFSEGYLRQ